MKNCKEEILGVRGNSGYTNLPGLLLKAGQDDQISEVGDEESPHTLWNQILRVDLL